MPSTETQPHTHMRDIVTGKLYATFRNARTEPGPVKEFLERFQRLDASIRAEYETRYRALLSSGEKLVQDYVDAQSLSEGSWYRPTHNRIVPLAMLAILRQSTEFDRDLVFAAQIHDVGYSRLKLRGTMEGAAWQNKDTREAHQIAGAEMCREILSELSKRGEVGLSAARIEQLATMISRHDNPYIGKPLDQLEERAVRDADRAFVVSALSFWKDLTAYARDSRYINSRAKSGDPRDLVSLRLASYHPDAETIPRDWDFERFHYVADLVTEAEGGKPEPQVTKAGKEIVDYLLLQRADEVRELSSLNQINEFIDLLGVSMRRDLDFLLKAAA